MGDRDMNVLLVNIKEAAKLLCISRRMLSILRSQNKIPFVVIGRRRLFDVRDLISFIDKNKVSK